MLTLAAATALAAPPVLLYADDLPRARHRAELDLGVDAAQPMRAAELLTASAPHLVRAAPIEACPGANPTDNAQILRLIGEAEEHRLTMRLDLARQRLEAAEEAWGCLGEPADATLGARLFFLLGAVAFASGDPGAAAEAFRAALRSDPDLSWDRDTAPDARGLFDAVRDEPPRGAVTVTLVPTDAELALRIDGRSLAPSGGQVAVSRGLHLVQLARGDRAATLWVQLEDDDWLVLPEQVGDDLTRRIDEPRVRLSVEGLAEAAGLDTVLLVPSRRSTWSLERTWEEARPPLVRRARAPVVAAGSVLLAVGGAWLAAETGGGRSRIDAADSGTLSSADYAVLARRHDAGRLRYTLALGLTGVGIATAGAGAAMWVISW